MRIYLCYISDKNKTNTSYLKYIKKKNLVVKVNT